MDTQDISAMDESRAIEIRRQHRPLIGVCRTHLETLRDPDDNRRVRFDNVGVWIGHCAVLAVRCGIQSFEYNIFHVGRT